MFPNCYLSHSSSSTKPSPFHALHTQINVTIMYNLAQPFGAYVAYFASNIVSISREQYVSNCMTGGKDVPG